MWAGGRPPTESKLFNWNVMVFDWRRDHAAHVLVGTLSFLNIPSIIDRQRAQSVAQFKFQKIAIFSPEKSVLEMSRAGSRFGVAEAATSGVERDSNPKTDFGGCSPILVRTRLKQQIHRALTLSFLLLTLLLDF